MAIESAIVGVCLLGHGARNIFNQGRLDMKVFGSKNDRGWKFGRRALSDQRGNGYDEM